jgi:UDP-N-acetylglucosamine diphosphorylase/glucosamine-1-phosphate N-acetyltransferase
MSDIKRNYILFDDHHRDHLLPLTFIRPVAEIRVGILTIREKWEKWLGERFSYLTQEYLREKYPLQITEDNILINGSVTPNAELILEILALKKGEILINENTFVAGYVDSAALTDFEGLAPQGMQVKKVNAPLNHIDKLWNIYRTNGEEIRSDFRLITTGRQSAEASKTNNLVNKDNIFIEEGATLEFVTINANPGPVYIGKDTTIMEGSLIRGPFGLCEGAILKMGTKIYGPTTIGPYSKVGGEVTNSVIMGHSNKVHEGYMGNSVMGEWCNIGAGSNTSNLKNNFALVKLWNYALGKFEDTDLQFCGLFMGDYARCGINTMFNTGTVVGLSSNIYGPGYPGSFIPSFSWGGALGFETFRLDKAIETIETVMSLNQIKLSDIDRRIFEKVFMLTGRYRKSI